MGLRANRSIVLAAVQECGEAIRFAGGEDLKWDRELALAAVERSASALKLIPVWYQNDHSFILDAVRANGDAIHLVSNKELCKDRHIVEAADKYWQSRAGKVDPLSSPRRGDLFLMPAARAFAQDYQKLMKTGGALGVRTHP